MHGLSNVESGIVGCRFLLGSAQRQAKYKIKMTDGEKPFGLTVLGQTEELLSMGGIMSNLTVGNPKQSAVRKLEQSFGNVFSASSVTDDLEIVRISVDLGTCVCSKSK